MTIYYKHSVNTVADRYDPLPYISGEALDTPSKLVIQNDSTPSQLVSLQSSMLFGSDNYLYSKIPFNPIFKLYNNIINKNT